MAQTGINGRYVATGLIGSGGMGEVYLARDELLGRDVAVKLLRERYASEEEFRERFRREAENAARLCHPNVVQVYDRGETERGIPFIVLEHVPGETLAGRLRREGPLDPLEAARIAEQIAHALSEAHVKGVVHRDIKPHNVFLCGDPFASPAAVKVGDFGIARCLAGPATSMTEATAVVGTARYLSPEQVRGEPASPASDLYSLGVTLYEMLVGKTPFEEGPADGPFAVAMRHATETPPSPREVNPGVPEGISALTARLLSKNPEARYGGDARAVAEDLQRIGRGLEPASAAPTLVATGERSGAPQNRRPGRRLAAVPLVLLLLFLVGAAWSLYASPGKEEAVPSGQSLANTAQSEEDATPSREPAAPDEDSSAPDRETESGTAELEEAVEEYYEAVDAEDFSYTYDHLASDSRAMFSEEEWIQKNRWYAENYPLKLASLSVEVEEGDAETRQVTVSRTFTDGTAFDRRTRFVYEGGSWKHLLSEEEIGFFLPGIPFEEFVRAKGGASSGPEE